MKIREVMDSDLESIVNIYNHYIENTTVLIEDELVSIDTMRQRISAVKESDFPWFVLDIDGVVQGFSYATRWKPKSRYKETVEPFIYLAQEFTGQGFGSAMYRYLLDSLKIKGFDNVMGVISLPNTPSIHLHQRLGFKKVGEFSNMGIKFNRKVSVGYWQLKFSGSDVTY
jgi:phosphinothricin acetyltransferase